MREEEMNLAIADLKYLLPLKRGDHAWVGGNYPRLIEELEKQRIHVALYDACAHGNDEDRQSGKFNLAIFPVFMFEDTEKNFELWRSGLSDGATLVFGCANPAYLPGILKSTGSQSGWGLTLEQGKSLAQKFGFKVERIFGNPGSIYHPRYLVDLETREPTQYYFKEIFTPYRRKSIIAGYLSAKVGQLLPLVRLYRSFVWQTTYHAGSGGDDVG